MWWLFCLCSNKACLKVRGWSKSLVNHRGLEVYIDRRWEVICLGRRRQELGPFQWVEFIEEGTLAAWSFSFHPLTSDSGFLLLRLTRITLHLWVSIKERLTLKRWWSTCSSLQFWTLWLRAGAELSEFYVLASLLHGVSQTPRNSYKIWAYLRYQLEISLPRKLRPKKVKPLVKCETEINSLHPAHWRL